MHEMTGRLKQHILTYYIHIHANKDNGTVCLGTCSDGQCFTRCKVVWMISGVDAEKSHQVVESHISEEESPWHSLFVWLMFDPTDKSHTISMVPSSDRSWQRPALGLLCGH